MSSTGTTTEFKTTMKKLGIKQTIVLYQQNYTQNNVYYSILPSQKKLFPQLSGILCWQTVSVPTSKCKNPTYFPSFYPILLLYQCSCRDELCPGKLRKNNPRKTNGKNIIARFRQTIQPQIEYNMVSFYFLLLN